MQNFDLVIFGITGNLAQKKLLPALVYLASKNLLPRNLKIIGISRRTPTVPKELCKNFKFIEGDVEKDPDLFKKIKESSKNSENTLYYLATYPDLYKKIFLSMKKEGLNKNKNGWVRLVIEKPLGNDFKSAKKLDILLHKYFDEKQIYRIDHYLGKNTFQNILVFRFGNELFEPLMNKDYIDHIQITSFEDFGIEDRGGYFDTTGTLKDVGQNHLLQMLVATVCEAPTKFTNKEVTKQRIKILKNLIAYPNEIVFGQYENYKNEKNVNPKSGTNTFFALKTSVNSERWKGVPIYIRAGKNMAKGFGQISMIFKVPNNRLFTRHELSKLPNVLTYKIQPNEKIEFEILTKSPGLKMKLNSDTLHFSYKKDTSLNIPGAYEKLIYDAITGNQTFFDDTAEVEASWKFIDKLNQNKKAIIYKKGSWGPQIANELIEKEGRKWINP